MLRVIYRWRVAEENIEEFTRVWRSTTNTIHATVEGALGSFMLRSIESRDETLTVAKWSSLESWQRFWGDEKPVEMAAMRKLGTALSTEVYEEIEDHTR